MHGFSTVDGFMNVNQSLEEMIKYLANEPSVGLFFVQQHAQNAMPNLLNLKDKVVERTHETTLHIEDLEDSIHAVQSMAECGPSIADEMIKDINESLLLMSTSLPHKGLIGGSRWGSQIKSGSQMPQMFSYSADGDPQGEGNSRSYLSAVFNTAKQKAVSLRWSQHDSTSKPHDLERLVPSFTAPQPSVAVGSLPSFLDTEAEELPVTSHTTDDRHVEQDNNTSGSTSSHDLASVSQNYEQFASEREAKLERWLEAFEERGRSTGASI